MKDTSPYTLEEVQRGLEAGWLSLDDDATEESVSKAFFDAIDEMRENYLEDEEEYDTLVN